MIVSIDFVPLLLLIKSNEMNSVDLIRNLIEKHCELFSISFTNVRNVVNEFENGKKSQKNYQKMIPTLYKILVKLPKDLVVLFLSTIELPTDQVPEAFKDLQSIQTCLNTDNTELKIILEYHESNLKSKQVDCEKKSKRGRKPKRKPDTAVMSVESVTNSKEDDVGKVNKLVSMCMKYVCNNCEQLHDRYSVMKKTIKKCLREKQYSPMEKSRLETLVKSAEKNLKWIQIFKSGTIPLKAIREEYGPSEIFLKEHKNGI